MESRCPYRSGPEIRQPDCRILTDSFYNILAWLFFSISALSGLGFFIIRLMPMQVPISIFYAFYRLRRPVLGATILGGVAVFIIAGLPTVGLFLIGMQVLFVLVDYVSDEARIFKAVELPEFEVNPSESTLDPGASVVVLELDGDERAYPLTYVAHHEVINDKIGERKVIVSFCNQCNAPLSYDTTNYSHKGLRSCLRIPRQHGHAGPRWAHDLATDYGRIVGRDAASFQTSRVVLASPPLG